MKFSFITGQIKTTNVLIYFRDDKNGIIGKKEINKYSKLSNYVVSSSMSLDDANKLMDILTK